MNKRNALLVLLLFAITPFAWSQTGIAGYVNNIDTGLPVVNHSVVVQSDSAYGPYYYVEAYTDFNGFFYASLPSYPGDSSGIVHVSTLDCQQSQQVQIYNYPEYNTTIVCNFWICSVPPAACQADFAYSSIGPLSLQFLDQSVGQDSLRTWIFGDGFGSNLANPVHTYQNPGYYDVYLIIGEPGSSCWDQEIKTIYIPDSATGDCNAYYTSYLDNDTSRLVYFSYYNQSTTNIGVYTWDFGDGVTTTIYNPENPDLAHQYAYSGTYTACLTVISSDSLCSDTYCMQIVIPDSISQCQANFSYNSIPGTSPLTVQFIDQSISAYSITWNWFYNDPTSGTVGIGTSQNPIFTFGEAGTYNVCLAISGPNCSDMFCFPVVVGQNAGCQANFTYFPDSVSSLPNFVKFVDLSLGNPTQWYWDFGDPASGLMNTTTVQNPTHQYTAVGTYNACLIISGNNCSDTICMTVVVGPNTGCQADFDALPAPNSLLTMNFVDQSQGDIWTWTWDFGDGTTQTVASPNNPNVSHTYQSPGFYNVCLTIQGDYGYCNSTYCETVAVYDSLTGCQAQFTHMPDSTGSGHHINFIDLSLGNPTSWSWDFGDGTATISLQNPSHVYSAPGTYTVCLTISGVDCQSVWCGTVNVSSVTTCVNYFTFSQIGNSVNFEGYILNGLEGIYSWDFGDNNTGTGQNVIHEYNAPGTYFVTLSTTAINGCAYTSTNIVSIGDTVVWGQFYGQVFAGNFPATQGMVLLFSVDTNNTFVPFVDISTIDSSGVYYFPMVPLGNYVIYAIPFENGYLPTYYGNTLNWQNATTVQPVTGTQNIPYNINLIESDGFTAGIGSIGGQITQGDFSASLIDKITMLLKDQNGNTILYSQVDPSGNFDFSQLAFGTYYLYAEMAGCETETILVNISESSPASVVMLTLSGNSILGNPDKIVSLDAGVIYPNPAKTDAQITVRLSSPSSVSVELYSMTGQMIYSKSEAFSSGETIILIPASRLPEGVYTLRIITAEGTVITRKLVKTR